MLKIKTPLMRLDYLIKPDRINVLRKQYEMFLEEDKKRKDRNDYILGRLDKMRYSSMAIQVRQPAGDYFPPEYNRHTYRPEKVERNDMQMVHVNQQFIRPGHLQFGTPRMPLDETSVLKEISKKYILIPKLRPAFSNDGLETIPPPVSAAVPSVGLENGDIDSNDWKSKYDILDQLKKKEKDELKQYANKDVNFSNNELTHINNLDSINANDHVMQNYKREDLPLRYEEEIPVKDFTDPLENELKTLEKCVISEEKSETPSTDVKSPLSLNSESAVPFYEQEKNQVYDQRAAELNDNVEYNSQSEVPAEQNVEPVSQTDNTVEYPENYSEQEFQQPQEQQYPIEYEQFIPETEVDTNHTEAEKVINQEENDYKPIEVINPKELIDEINNENIDQEAIVAAHTYSAEVANAIEFVPDDEVFMQHGQGKDPPITVPEMTREITPDESGIEEFDAEQRELFYSEQADENYAHDQENAGDPYNAEYAQNENYPQTQEYAYYEGAEQEEATYPVEINEHEETQQMYDQHYEQQFAANYEQGYEQQTVYMEQDPTLPKFEQPALYDKAEQEFEQYTFDQHGETQEEVEQVLDREDGYIQKNVQDPALQTAGLQGKQAELNVP